MTKQEVLQGALALNDKGKNYSIQVEGDKIITTIKWMDAVFFSPNAVTDEMRNFAFSVKLRDDNTYTETDSSQAVTKTVGMGGARMNYSSFKGKQVSINRTIGFGKNRNDGTTGLIQIQFNSEDYKKPVREYLASCGYHRAKKGLFATLFGKE